MKRNLLSGLLLLSFAILTLFGCGGGGGGGDSAPTTTVSGTVAKGLVSGSTVQVFEIISSHNPAKARIAGTALTQGTTAADGTFAINIGGSIIKGGLLVKATGGTYRDEATGANATLSIPLNAAFPNISGMVRRGEGVTVNVTPLTEMGFRAIGTGNRPTDANIAAANGKVVSTLGLTGVNIITTEPVPADVAAPAGATAAQIDYGLALAVVSQMMQGKTLEQIETDFAPDIQAGVLSPANDAAGTVATLNFLNSPFNQTGGSVDGLTVAVTASKTNVTNNNVDTSVIRATVKMGEDNVPNGTQVSFVIKSGAGANLSAASANTVGGVASVDLKGTTDGAVVVVTASAGGVASDAPAVNFLDPNKPGAVALAFAPATGVTTVVSPVPVTLTATVTPVSPQGTIANGTPVTFTIVSGTGGTLSAVTTTTNGVATATLNSSAPGTIAVTATAGTATSAPANVPFVNQPTEAIVTVSLTGTLPVGRLIGGTTARIGFAANKGLGTPTFQEIGIGAAADVLTTNPAVNPVITPAAWTSGTQPGDLVRLTFPITAGNFPTAADFSVDPASTVIDLSNVSLAGAISVSISVQIQ